MNGFLTMSKRARFMGLISLMVVFELVNYLIGERLYMLTPFEWLMLAFAGSFIGRAVAYMTIFEWLRDSFKLGVVVPHSSGVGEEVEPACKSGFWSAICELITCPLCAGTWGGAGLLLLYAYYPAIGQPMLWTLSAGSVGAFITRLTEAAEWSKYLLWERTAKENANNKQSRYWEDLGVEK